MKAKRLTRVVAGLAALTLAGCGGGNGGTTAGSGEANPNLVRLDGQTLEVAAVWSGDEQARMTEVLNQFQTDTGATVRYVSTGDEIAATLTPRIAAGSPPDIAILPQPGLLNDLATAGSLKPLNAEVRTLVENNYDKSWQDLGSVNNQLYGVWFKAANKSTVWYDKEDFTRAGVQPPTDWNGFLATARTLSDAGVQPVSVGGADGWTLTDWFENVYLRTAGPEKYDQLAKHEIPWTDPSVGTALNELAKLWGQPQLLAGGTAGSLQTDFPTSVQKVFSPSGGAAMVYEGDFVASSIKEAGAELGTKADFFPFPSINGSKPSVVGGGDVAVLLKDTPASQELMKYLASARAAEIWAKSGSYISPNKNVNPAVYPDDISRRLATSLVDAETFRFDMSDLAPAAFGGTKGSGEWKILQDFLANPSNVQGTQQALEAAAKPAFDAAKK